MWSNSLDKISYWSLFLVIVLLPVFFLPFFKVPVGAWKGFLLVVGLAIAIIFWTAARFSDGKIVLPKSWLLVSGFGVVLVFLLSALFSSVQGISLFGIMFDVGAFWFMLAAFLIMLVSSVLFLNRGGSRRILIGVIIAS